MEIREMQKWVHQIAVEHGWWDDTPLEPRTVLTVLCLIHSEVSEAVEAHREGNPLKFEEELADVAIRLFDAAEAWDVDLETEMTRKNVINEKRSYRHGGKRA